MYLDPGFGGMLVQVIVALATVGGAIIFSLRKKIKNLFTRKKDDTADKPKNIVSKTDSPDDMIDTIDDDSN